MNKKRQKEVGTNKKEGKILQRSPNLKMLKDGKKMYEHLTSNFEN